MEQFSNDRDQMMAWAKKEAAKDTKDYNRKNGTISVSFSKDAYIPKNEERIAEESQYDGFYAVVTNLEGDVEEILKINKRRWEIEENFRIMKKEFKARPVYVQRDDRIKAHFLVCYISLSTFRAENRSGIFVQADFRDSPQYADDTSLNCQRWDYTPFWTT